MAHRKFSSGVIKFCLIVSCIIIFALVPIFRQRWSAAREDMPAKEKEADKPQLTVALSLPRQVYRPLDPIIATVKIINSSEETVHLKMFGAYQSVDFEVDQLNSTNLERVPKTFYYKRQVEQSLGVPTKGGEYTLRPGEVRTKRLVVNIVSDMTLTAPYSVVAALPYWTSVERDPKQERVARSAPLKVEVKGRTTNPNRNEIPELVKVGEKPHLAVELTLPKEVYGQLEPIKATVKVTNVGEQVVHLRTYRNPYQNFDFEVDLLEFDGADRAPNTYYHDQSVRHAQGAAASENLLLKPGASRQEELIVNWVAEMTAGDRYSVVVAVPYWLAANRDPAQRRAVRSAPVNVKVEFGIKPPNN